jgi:hypothetical protein
LCVCVCVCVYRWWCIVEMLIGFVARDVGQKQCIVR